MYDSHLYGIDWDRPIAFNEGEIAVAETFHPLIDMVQELILPSACITVRIIVLIYTWQLFQLSEGGGVELIFTVMLTSL